ncbi:MAG: recombinase RecT [Thermodesulfobacteriota bacterium]
MNNQVATQQGMSVAQVLSKSIPALKMALPKSMDPDRMARIALTTIRRNSALMRCDANSLAGAVLEAASLGLEIDSRGLAYLVPYGQEATLIPGYKGLMQLAYRSGKIANIYADVVFQKEVEAGKVEITLGDSRSIRHDFDIIQSATLREERKDNPPVLAYAVAVFHDGHRHFEFVTAPEVAKRKAASKAAERGFLWTKWVEEAWKKTAIRKLCKYLDLSPEMQRAIVLDEQADTEAKQTFDMAGSIDVDFTVDNSTDDLAAKVQAAAQAAQPQPPASASVHCPLESEREGEPVTVYEATCEKCDQRGSCKSWQ